MDNTSFQQQESDTRKNNSFLASLQIFDSLLPLMRRSVSWLAGLLKLTEEEQEDAAIYLSRLGNE
jgi:hypothetical protein